MVHQQYEHGYRIKIKIRRAAQLAAAKNYIFWIWSTGAYTWMNGRCWRCQNANVWILKFVESQDKQCSNLKNCCIRMHGEMLGYEITSSYIVKKGITILIQFVTSNQNVPLWSKQAVISNIRYNHIAPRIQSKYKKVISFTFYQVLRTTDLIA